MEAKHARAMGAYFERQANVHPLSKPLDPAIRVQLVKESLANQHHQYFKMRNNQHAAEEYRQAKRDCNLLEEIETIPSKILTDMKFTQHDTQVAPSFLHEELLYYEQFEAVLPPEEFAKKVAATKMIRAYEGQVEVQEEITVNASDMPKITADDFPDVD